MTHKAEGHIVTVETTTGEVHRGKIMEAGDNMNSQMSSVNFTYRDGGVNQLDNIYIYQVGETEIRAEYNDFFVLFRVFKIRFMILPVC